MKHSDTSSKVILGWDIGGTKCAVVMGTSDGKILAREEWKTVSTPGFEEMLSEFLSCALRLCKEHGSIFGLGVSVGGPMNMKTGEVFSPPHLPGWGDIDLKVILENLCLAVIRLVQGYFIFSLNKINILFFGPFNLHRTNPVRNVFQFLPVDVFLAF
jgi:hypothetical protein